MSSSLLINEPPLQVLPRLAQNIGLNEAIVLQQIHYWISDKRSKTLIDERKWVYNTYAQWQEQFPFWSKDTIIRTIKSLKEKGLILIREGDVSTNRLKYYSIDYQVLDSLTPMQNAQTSMQNQHESEDVYAKCIDPSMQNAQTSMQVAVTPIYKERARVSETTQRLPTERESRACATPHPSQDAPPPSLSSQDDLVKNPFHEKKPTKRKVANQGTYLPEDWELPSEWREWSLQCGMFNEEIDMIQMKFKNYWLGTNKNALKKNWYMTWQNWCIGEYEKKGKILKLQTTPSRQAVHVPLPEPTLVQRTSSNPQIQKWHDLQTKLSTLVGEDNYNSWLADLPNGNFEFMGIETFKDISGKTYKEAKFRAKNRFLADQIAVRFLESLFLIVKEIDSGVLTESAIKIVTMT